MKVPKPVTVRDDKFRHWVAQHPCVVSNKDCQYARYVVTGGWFVSDFAHLRTKRNHGDQGFPACRFHHQEQHRVGIKTFQQRHSLDLRAIAEALWDTYTTEGK